jgi:hypothetical protein
MAVVWKDKKLDWFLANAKGWSFFVEKRSFIFEIKKKVTFLSK